MKSRRIREAWVARHGWLCAGWGDDHPPHPSTDLTVHHVASLAATGTDTGEYVVLCRAMNARIGAA